MAAQSNGHAVGVNGHHEYELHSRFSDIPSALDVPVHGEDGDEAVNLDLTNLEEDTNELCDLLENEHVARTYWVTIAMAYAKQDRVSTAIDMLQTALRSLQNGGKAEDRLSVLACLCWMYLWKCRRAPRTKPTQPTDDDRTKEHWLQVATSTLNDALRINPSYPPLHLARGALCLLKSSLSTSRAGAGSLEPERVETLKQAAKCFDETYRASHGKNVLAMLGKAKVHFTMGRYAESLALYQQSLERRPDLLDPDPRIGIGCCLWQLGHKEQAKAAWQRSLDLNDDSKMAHILLGLCYLDESSQYNSSDPNFTAVYKKAMTEHTQTAFKLDSMHALTCATFGSYFVLRKAWPNVERLARRAIEQTEVNAVASDGWYLLAKKEHYEGDMSKASEYYTKADQARGGDEKGYLPAKFGAAQLKTLMGDYDGAKFRLDKIVTASKNLEAMTLLGMLYADDVFVNRAAGTKEDKSMEQKKATALLEQVRVSWKDPKKKLSPDSAVLVNLARLYEMEQPEKALACLLQVEQMELDRIIKPETPESEIDEAELHKIKREMLSPQLLNNIGCFRFQAEKFPQARDDFQAALNACVKIRERDPSIDADALVTTLMYNLARTNEAGGLHDEAKNIYSGLLERHPDYVDASTRLAYIAFQATPAEGAQAIKQLIESNPSDPEVRSLYGWFINRTKKPTGHLNEDQEQRHYKHTLQNFDKHDTYSLIGMGNLHLAVAREMPRNTDQEKERRSKTFMRAVEFFDKVLTLDPKNAFAAQGLGIAMVEDKRDTGAGIQIFSKVRESIKGFSASVHLNLGHIFAETKQWSRSIENYELALIKSKDRDGKGPDPQIMACLGRVWLMRGRQEKTLEAYKTSLDYSNQALELNPQNIKFKFNVAFVQIQLAQQLNQLLESQRSLQDVEQAGQGLDAAIDAFTEIAASPNPPFPKGDLEQRANMGRNTMKRQLAAALERQKEYEKKNADKLEEARKRREEEIKKREEEKRVAAEKAAAERRQIAEEREKIAQEDREFIQRRLEEDRMREEAEYTTDAETGERKKREKKPKEKRQKRKKKGDESDTDAEVTDAEDGSGRKGRSRNRPTSTTPGSGSDGEAPRRKKKRKLERRGQAVKSSKYKSSEMVEDSDEDDDATADGPIMDNSEAADETMADDAGEAETVAPRTTQRKRPARILDDDDEEEEEEDEEDAAEMNGHAATDDAEVTAAGSDGHGGDL
nr:tetratricopeptide repeat protein 1 [Quercus suber]